MKYRHYPEFENDEVVWRVHEKATDQVVAEFLFEEDAQEYHEFLEDGGAFAGFTPTFMLTRMALNTNDAFAMTFT